MKTKTFRIHSIPSIKESKVRLFTLKESEHCYFEVSNIGNDYSAYLSLELPKEDYDTLVEGLINAFDRMCNLFEEYKTRDTSTKYRIGVCGKIKLTNGLCINYKINMKTHKIIISDSIGDSITIPVDMNAKTLLGKRGSKKL